MTESINDPGVAPFVLTKSPEKTQYFIHNAAQAALWLLVVLSRRTKCGEMPEWSNGHAWKACVRETVPRVRIPVSPPYFHNSLNFKELFYCQAPIGHNVGTIFRTPEEQTGPDGTKIPDYSQLHHHNHSPSRTHILFALAPTHGCWAWMTA